MLVCYRMLAFERYGADGEETLFGLWNFESFSSVVRYTNQSFGSMFTLQNGYSYRVTVYLVLIEEDESSPDEEHRVGPMPAFDVDPVSGDIAFFISS